MAENALRLHQAVQAVCPISGVEIRTEGDSASCSFTPTDAATVGQRAAARAAIDAFDWSSSAYNAWLADQYPERKAIRNAAAQAVADIDTYLALANPSNAQITAQVRRLSQMMKQVIQRLVQLD